MKNHGRVFDQGQPSSKERVDEQRDKEDSPVQKGALPAFVYVKGIVEDNQSLNHCSRQERSTCGHRLPAERREPACDPAENA